MITRLDGFRSRFIQSQRMLDPTDAQSRCKAGYHRLQVASGSRTKVEYRCLLCDHVFEVFDGSTEVAIRLTVQPETTAK
jgi:hypothetical protein